MMTPRPDSDDGPMVFDIDGRRIKSSEDFFAEIGRSVNGPGGYFGQNLDALADCLRGGFGTPEDRPYEFDWHHSAVSRRHLKNGRHTFFDSVREAFRDAGVTLKLS